MWTNAMVLFFILSAATVNAADGVQTGNSTQAGGTTRIELSTRDQNCPGVLLGLPQAIAHLDRPRGGIKIDLLPDDQIILYLSFQICTQDMFGRDRYCTEPPDYYFEGRIQEVGAVSAGEHSRTLYDMIIKPGTLRTRLVITGQGEYFLVVPLDSEDLQYQRVKLFVSSE
jgi:hypothetical protein